MDAARAGSWGEVVVVSTISPVLLRTSSASSLGDEDRTPRTASGPNASNVLRHASIRASVVRAGLGTKSCSMNSRVRLESAELKTSRYDRASRPAGVSGIVALAYCLGIP